MGVAGSGVHRDVIHGDVFQTILPHVGQHMECCSACSFVSHWWMPEDLFRVSSPTWWKPSLDSRMFKELFWCVCVCVCVCTCVLLKRALKTCGNLTWAFYQVTVSERSQRGHLCLPAWPTLNTDGGPWHQLSAGYNAWAPFPGDLTPIHSSTRVNSRVMLLHVMTTSKVPATLEVKYLGLAISL